MVESLKTIGSLRRWLVLAVLCLPAGHAHAEDTGFEASFRVGYAFPLGNVSGANDSKLSDGVSGQLPLMLDVGYRVLPNLFIGVYGQYGFAFVGDAFDEVCNDSSPVDCSAHDIRLGIEGHYHFRPQHDFDPWVGIGFGYEWLNISAGRGDIESSSTMHGFEFFNLQVGLDVLVTRHFYAGPFVSMSFSQFSELSISCKGVPAGGCDAFDGSTNISDKALHEWLMLGVRGSFAP